MLSAPINDRLISFGDGLPEIPERLLLAHAQGKVLFIAGAGISQPSFPNFRELVLKVYESTDPTVWRILNEVPNSAHNQFSTDLSSLKPDQSAEVKRFIQRDFDVVLGMLERRIDGISSPNSRVRREIRNILKDKTIKPSSIHSSLMRLADRGGAISIATTNFELLLELAAKKFKTKVPSYSLGGIPRPGRNKDFSGVFHIHGALQDDDDKSSELIISDHDFGEFYLRRRGIPDFIYDAARLFNIVLVGYSANDPPMRYLLNAVAADGNRFEDLKERFTFLGADNLDPISLEDWKARGITPIPYKTDGPDHSALGHALKKWSNISHINGSDKFLNDEIKRIVKQKKIKSSDSDKDLFEHLIRRNNDKGVARIASYMSSLKVDFEWLDTLIKVASEKKGKYQ